MIWHLVTSLFDPGNLLSRMIPERADLFVPLYAPYTRPVSQATAGNHVKFVVWRFDV